MATKKISSAPLPSPREKALAAIDADVKKLTAVKAAYEAEIARLEAKHQGQWTSDDWADCRELPGKVELLGKQLRGLRERRIEVEAGPAHHVSPASGDATTKATATRARRRQWPTTKNLKEPAYPSDAIARGDRKAINKAWEAVVDFNINAVMKSLAASGASPDTPASMELLATVAGSSNAIKKWLGSRVAEAEQTIAKLAERIVELEAAPIRYRGVWQRSEEYKRGAVVTESGSCWHAAKDAPIGERPGTGDSWQLMVKAGKDAR